VAGAKIVNAKDGKTIGQIISPPVKGTNVVLAVMRLQNLGLLAGGTWSKLNKVKIGKTSNNEWRYLPYLPLWWPEIDPETGKAKEEGENQVDEDEQRDEEAGASPDRSAIPLTRIEIDEQFLTDDQPATQKENSLPSSDSTKNGAAMVDEDLSPPELFDALCNEDKLVGLEEMLRWGELQEMIADGDLEKTELDSLFFSVTKSSEDANRLDKAGFVDFCEKIDALFEEYDEE